MSSAESQIPTPPTWREYLDARLEPLATRELVRSELNGLERRLVDEMKKDRRWLFATLLTVIGVGVALAGLILRLTA